MVGRDGALLAAVIGESVDDVGEMVLIEVFGGEA